MKIYAFLLFALPFSVAGQTKNYHEQAMQKFQKFYNAGQGDSINAMFKHEWDQTKASEPMWTNKSATDALNEFGSLKSIKFIGIDTLDPQKVYVFQTFFSKAGRKTTSFTLDKDNNLRTFRFITTSEGISQLLKSRKGN